MSSCVWPNRRGEADNSSNIGDNKCRKMHAPHRYSLMITVSRSVGGGGGLNQSMLKSVFKCACLRIWPEKRNENTSLICGCTRVWVWVLVCALCTHMYVIACECFCVYNDNHSSWHCGGCVWFLVCDLVVLPVTLSWERLVRSRVFIYLWENSIPIIKDNVNDKDNLWLVQLS